MGIGPNVEDLVTQLITFGEGRPMLHGVYSDKRKGLLPGDKLVASLELIMAEGLANVLAPPALAEKQCRAPEIAATKVGDMKLVDSESSLSPPPVVAAKGATALLYACGAALPLSSSIEKDVKQKMVVVPQQESARVVETRANLVRVLLSAVGLTAASNDDAVAAVTCCVGPHGLMPLHVACMNAEHSPALLQTLLAIGNGGTDPWLDCVDHYGFSPLHYALKSSELAAKMLVDAGASPLPPGSNPPPLHLACEFGRDAQLIQQLLDRSTVIQGVDVNITSSTPNDLGAQYSGTALHLAAEGGHESAVSALLAVAEVDVTARRPATGATALHLACSRGHAGVVGLLAKHSAAAGLAVDLVGRTPLAMAVQIGSVACVSALIESGNVSAEDIAHPPPPQEEAAAAASPLSIAEEANMNASAEEVGAVAASEAMLVVLLAAIGIATDHIVSSGPPIPQLDAVAPVMLEQHVHKCFAYGVTPQRWSEALLKTAAELAEEAERMAAALMIQGKARQRKAKKRVSKKRDQKKKSSRKLKK
jgi:ankyrin repeat protein